MADIRRERRPEHERVYSKMHGEVMPIPAEGRPGGTWTYFVRVCGFTFEFVSLAEIREALDWFETKLHPSSKLNKPTNWDEKSSVCWKTALSAHHHESQRWHERLPAGLTSEPRREKVVAALRRALQEFEP